MINTDIMKDFKQIVQEINLGRLFQHTEERCIAIISACRAEYTDSENKSRTKNLEMSVRQKGFGYVKLTGYYVENFGTEDEKHVQEYPLLITADDKDKNLLRSFAVEQGKKFDQDSILFKLPKQDAILIGTASGVFPGLNTEYKLGSWHPNKISTFYSKLKNQKTFTFESIERNKNILTLANER